MTATPLDAARDALIALQGQLIALLAAQKAALAARAGELEAENAELSARMDRLERTASRNSGNSSLPPSLDDRPGRTPAGGRRSEGKGRNPGKQPGAPGSHLAWSKNPDRTVPHFPRGACACGADLAGAADLGVAASHQQIEIPELTATVIQHDLHEVACACERVHRAAAPAGVAAPGTVTYGIPVRHPRLPLHRRQARHQRLHRATRRTHRKRLDAAHSRRRLNAARSPSRGATQANVTYKSADLLTQRVRCPLAALTGSLTEPWLICEDRQFLFLAPVGRQFSGLAEEI